MEILKDKEIWFIRLNINASSHLGSREKLFWIEETCALRPIGLHVHLLISVDIALVSSSNLILMHTVSQYTIPPVMIKKLLCRKHALLFIFIMTINMSIYYWSLEK